MKTETTTTEYRCEHCGRTSEGTRPTECPRCSRTHFSERRVMSTAELARINHEERLARIAAAAERVANRRRVAADIRKLRATGWWGYQIVPAAERLNVARRAIAAAK